MDTLSPNKDTVSPGKETVRPNKAGIDVHKKMLAVVVRSQQQDQVHYEKRTFGTNRQQLMELTIWLLDEKVSEVAMESTAQYWRPVWAELEPHFKLRLTHPLETRAPRGRKRDFRDAQRLVDRLWAGDLATSFIPDAEQRDWRSLTRRRVQMKRQIVAIRNQMEGVLEECGIKLSCVVTDLLGITGREILRAMAQGQTDGEALARLARGSLKSKRKDLEAAVAGGLRPVQRTVMGQMLEQVSLIESQIKALTQELVRAMGEHIALIERLTHMPGIDVEAAQELLAEIGPRAEVFATPQHLASWIGVCPGRQESAGISRSNRSAKGNVYLRRLVCQIAWSAVRVKDSFFEGLFRRYCPRMGPQAAIWAVAHRIVKVLWKLLREQVEYKEKGRGAISLHTMKSKLRRYVKQLLQAGLDPEKFFKDVADPLTAASTENGCG